ncbi:unnamed protein product [Laminaria digitata]
MFGLGTDPSGARQLAHYLDLELAVLIVVGVVAATNIVPAFKAMFRSYSAGLDKERLGQMMSAGEVVRWLSLSAVMLYTLMLMAAGSYNPFIYFRF